MTDLDEGECRSEVYSWWYFTPDQTDAYWIRCTLTIPHDQHEDSHTGLTWPADEQEKQAMAWTSHGHQIPGTVHEMNGRPTDRARCGGVERCETCKAEIEVLKRHQPDLFGRTQADKPYFAQQAFDARDFQAKAIHLVFEYIKDKLEKTDTHISFAEDEVYVVWFSKTLQNWKALISTTLPDGMYYEVTYNGDAKETYIDAYKKWDNVKIPD